MSAPAGRGAIVFVLITIVLDMLAIGIIVPVLAPLVGTFFPGDSHEGVHAFGIALTVWAATQFFAAPILGALSDRFGRRPVILVSIAGLGLSFLGTALATSFTWFLASRMISGATAGAVAAANAYIADVTPPAERARAFGWLGAAFSAGFTLGPALGGLLGAIDVRLPFYVAATLCLANAAYGFFMLPESLKPSLRRDFSWRRANPIGVMGVFRGQPALLGLLPVYACFALAQNVFPVSFVLYATHRYGFDSAMVGLTMAASSLLGIVSQLLIVPRAVAWLREERALAVSLTGGAVGFVCYALAPSAVWFWAAMPILTISSLFMPSMQSLMTRSVTPDAQGRMQGGLASLMSIANVLAPSFYTAVFAWGVGREQTGDGIFAGAPFFAAATILSVGLALTLRALWRKPAR